MRDVVCDTSPIQYLRQLHLLLLHPALARRVLIPPAVLREIEQGKAAGIDLPDIRSLEWVMIRSPTRISALPFEHDLGPGETEVLLLAGEIAEVVAVLDDGLARRVATPRSRRLNQQ